MRQRSFFHLESRFEPRRLLWSKHFPDLSGFSKTATVGHNKAALAEFRSCERCELLQGTRTTVEPCPLQEN